jgi:iron complex outermembrane receptor protein
MPSAITCYRTASAERFGRQGECPQEMSTSRLRHPLVLSALLLHLLPVPATAQRTAEELKRLSLEELMDVRVSTVSRTPEPTSTVPAAIHVITDDDIRRSGATTLAEALRLAPGLQVARLDATRYAIGIRGFADRLARSMLVLIDGRAVYSPLFAGTYWEVQDTMLEDVDRIEVIRGPGGTLWGANAVNGIINIITKSAAATQGMLVSATVGRDMQGPLGVRYGGRAGSNFHYRLYGRLFDYDEANAGADDPDGMRKGQGGFRGDWTFSRSRDLTLQGDIYRAGLDQQARLPLYSPPFQQVVTRNAPLSGANVRARWASPGAGGRYQVQTYYDRTSRDEQPVAETRDTFDLDFQHQRPLGGRHSLVWGAGYRVSSGRIEAVAPTAFTPARRTDHLYTAFVQDDISLVPDRVRLVVGTKIEHNDYTGFELQPGARALWTVDPTNTVFAAVTRAVRTPSRVETDYTTTSTANPAVPVFVRLLPNPDFTSERLTAYELGYRTRPWASVYMSASAFFNHLDDTLSTELVSPGFVETSPGSPRVVIPVRFANGVHGNTHGIEVTADTRPAVWWRWTAHYSYLRVQITKDPGSADVSQERRYEGLSPRHQVLLQSSLDLPRAVYVDWILRYVSELSAGPVPDYSTSTVRVAWRARPQLEFAVVGRDLHDSARREWADGGRELGRSAYVTLTWRR